MIHPIESIHKDTNLAVGLLLSKSITVKLNGVYRSEARVEDKVFVVELCEDLIALNGKLYPELVFRTENGASFFELVDVMIGIGFHWERKENQSFKGDLKIVVEGKNLRAINLIDVESYLESVISSEMSPKASLNLLKSHAVISRSWLLYPLQRNVKAATQAFHQIEKPGEWIRWYERDAHVGFDVCADDHCQRYQGITKIVDSNAKQAVNETKGLVLGYQGEICDARFSKCCGGVTEEFENCWSDIHYNYLLSFPDSSSKQSFGDLTKEEAYESFQNRLPELWCNTNDPTILSQVLNDFDRETNDFFRWKVRYSQTEISNLLRKKSGMNFGNIKRLVPLTRTKSGRIVRLKIVGEFCEFIIGKELEIRKWLSETHLYSSAFYVELVESQDEYPDAFVLRGSGWGHGVGLCQIGAAVMGERGVDYTDILAHYYPNASLHRIY